MNKLDEIIKYVEQKEGAKIFVNDRDVLLQLLKAELYFLKHTHLNNIVNLAQLYDQDLFLSFETVNSFKRYVLTDFPQMVNKKSVYFNDVSEIVKIKGFQAQLKENNLIEEEEDNLLSEIFLK